MLGRHCRACRHYVNSKCDWEVCLFEGRDKQPEIDALHNCGIFTTAADYNAHFGPISHYIYWYSTQGMRATVQSNPQWLIHNQVYFKELPKSGEEGLLVVGENCLIPHDLPMISRTKVHKDILALYRITDAFKSNDTSYKGKMGEMIVASVLLRAGRAVIAITDPATQVSGIDLRTQNGPGSDMASIDAKWDEPAGPSSVYGCCGNLAVQTKEINPSKSH